MKALNDGPQLVQGGFVGQSADELKVAVTLKTEAGISNLGPVSARRHNIFLDVHEAMPSFTVKERAKKLLEKRGFEVTTEGPLTISARVTPDLYKDTFKTQLVEMTPHGLSASVQAPILYPPDGASWEMDAELSEVVDDVYIQWPHIYMNNRFGPGLPYPIAPDVDYHHLSVDGEVPMLINANRVHQEGGTGQGVTVVMIDSGFAHGHPYFVEKGYNTSVVLAPRATHVDRDMVGHGTGESANVLSIAPGVNFVGIKLDNEDNPSAGATLLEGIQEARRHNPDVVTVSLGFHIPGFSSIPNGLLGLEAEIRALVANGTVVVFSAGNGHVSFPGMMPEVISAGGVFVAEDGAMAASDYASAFMSRIYPGRSVPDFCGLVGMMSNHADYIMLPIPVGCEIDIDGAMHDGTTANDGWGVFSGTSAAAPQLAGVCALLLEKNPNLTPTEVKAILRRTCRDVVNGNANAVSNGGIPIFAGPGADGATGAGLVDAYAAWMQA